jgi:hypothetical protein
MKKTISRKLTYVRTDGWRGYEKPVNSICGANDTGTYSDSPCPSDVCESELQTCRDMLRKANIAYIQMTCNTSNVFCVHRYLCVHPSDRKAAVALLQPLVAGTRLLYVEPEEITSEK